MSYSVIIIPTYNEVENIPHLIKSIRIATRKLTPKTIIHVLVVDDSSPDGTGNMVSMLSKTYSSSNFKIELLTRKQKNGLDKAYLHGFRYTLENIAQAHHVIQMDADLSHDPIHLAEMIRKAHTKTNILVVGSRYVPGGDIPDWKLSRRILSKGANTYARFFLGKKISDYTGGYNLYSTDLLRKIVAKPLRSSGYAFLSELKYRAVLHSANISEVPIIFRDRTHGKSKIPRNTIIKTALIIPRLSLKRLLSITD